MARIAMVAALSLVLLGCGGTPDATSDAQADVDLAEAADGEVGEGTPPGDEAAADDDGDPKEEAELALPAPGDEAPDADPDADPDAEPDDPDGEVEEDGPPVDDLPGGRYVQLDEVQRDGDTYAVAFTSFNFEPFIGTGPDDYHIHFFFDDIEPENAGTNGPSPGQWFLYDGPSPFSGYTLDDKPEAATRMCALVADAAHAVTLDSGNCVTLP